MCFKELLRPEWKKFVLPIIFIILFLFTISTFYSVASVMDKYVCSLTDLIKEQHTAFENNDTVTINETQKKINETFQVIGPEFKQLEDFWPVVEFIKFINPITPIPCELSLSDFCMFYTNEDTYNCFKSTEPPTSLSIIELEVKPYKKVSISAFALSIMILFLEGYLISAVVLFSWRKLRKKMRKASIRRPTVIFK